MNVPLGFLVPTENKSTLAIGITGTCLSILRKVPVHGTEDTCSSALTRVDYSLSLAKWQELTEPSWPFIRVTQAPQFRNSPVWTFHIFRVLSQELVHRKWPLEVKQQLEIALECALKHRWKGVLISMTCLEDLRMHLRGGEEHWSGPPVTLRDLIASVTAYHAPDLNCSVSHCFRISQS